MIALLVDKLYRNKKNFVFTLGYIYMDLHIGKLYKIIDSVSFYNDLHDNNSYFKFIDLSYGEIILFLGYKKRQEYVYSCWLWRNKIIFSSFIHNKNRSFYLKAA